MKMKLSLALALAHKPKLLILDEPTSGVDPIARDEILDVFREYIQDENNSIILSSHITTDLEKISDYITFIDKGKIILSEEKDRLIYGYAIMKGTKELYDKLDKSKFIGARKNNFGFEALTTQKDYFAGLYPEIQWDNATLEDIMLFHIKGER